LTTLSLAREEDMENLGPGSRQPLAGIASLICGALSWISLYAMERIPWDNQYLGLADLGLATALALLGLLLALLGTALGILALFKREPKPWGAVLGVVGVIIGLPGVLGAFCLWWLVVPGSTMW